MRLDLRSVGQRKHRIYVLKFNSTSNDLWKHIDDCRIFSDKKKKKFMTRINDCVQKKKQRKKRNDKNENETEH